MFVIYVFHEGMIEKEKQLFFFWDFYLFELICLLIHWFSNGFKSRRVSDFVVDYFWNNQE